MFNSTNRKRKKAIEKEKFHKWKANLINELEEEVKSLEDNLPKTDGYTHKYLSEKLEDKKNWLSSWKEGRVTFVMFDDSNIDLSEEELQKIELEIRAQ